MLHSKSTPFWESQNASFLALYLTCVSVLPFMREAISFHLPGSLCLMARSRRLSSSVLHFPFTMFGHSTRIHLWWHWLELRLGLFGNCSDIFKAMSCQFVASRFMFTNWARLKSSGTIQGTEHLLQHDILGQNGRILSLSFGVMLDACFCSATGVEVSAYLASGWLLY